MQFCEPRYSNCCLNKEINYIKPLRLYLGKIKYYKLFFLFFIVQHSMNILMIVCMQFLVRKKTKVPKQDSQNRLQSSMPAGGT